MFLSSATFLQMSQWNITIKIGASSGISNSRWRSAEQGIKSWQNRSWRLWRTELQLSLCFTPWRINKARVEFFLVQITSVRIMTQLTWKKNDQLQLDWSPEAVSLLLTSDSVSESRYVTPLKETSPAVAVLHAWKLMNTYDLLYETC